MQADLQVEVPLWATQGRPVLVAKALAGSGTGAGVKVWFGRGRRGSSAWMLAACFDFVGVPSSLATQVAPLQHADSQLTVVPEVLC